MKLLADSYLDLEDCDSTCHRINLCSLFSTFSGTFRQNSGRELTQRLKSKYQSQLSVFGPFSYFVQYFSLPSTAKHLDNKMRHCTHERETFMGCNH